MRVKTGEEGKMQDKVIYEDLLSTQEAAAYVGISATSLYQKVKRGHITPYKQVGRVSLFAKKDLDRYLEMKKDLVRYLETKKGIDLLTAAEAAVFLKTDRAGIRRLKNREDGLKFYRFRKQYLYAREDLEKWLEEGK